MGRPGVLRKPDLAGGEHRELNDALHRLHLLAGRPSLTVMARELREAGISRSSIHDAFSSPRLPQWHVVDALVEILASKAPGLRAEEQLKSMHSLWLRAAEAEDPVTMPSAQSITTPRYGTMPPEHKTILLLDIAQFGKLDDSNQEDLRRALFNIADYTLAVAGIDETQRQRTDRGDSVMELIDADVPVAALLRALLHKTPSQWRATNQMHFSSVLGLLGVLAMGNVAGDGRNGWVGSDLNHASLLLDANPLRAALQKHNKGFALCISDSVYQGTVRHGHPGIPADGFHQAAFESKNAALTAWLADPVFST